MSAPPSSSSILKSFCLQEGLPLPIRQVKDTNNGFFACLEVRTSKSDVIFSKTKWVKSSAISKDKVFNLLAFEFLESVGIPLINNSYWLNSTSDSEINEDSVTEGERKSKSQKPKSQKPKASKPKRKIQAPPENPQDQFDKVLDEALDDVLDEVPEESTTQMSLDPSQNPMMEVLGPFLKMTSGIKDQSPQGFFEAMTTEGGLSQLGTLLQNPMMAKMMSGAIGAVTSVAPEEEKGEEKEAIFEIVDSSDDILLSQSTASLGNTE